MTTPTQTVFTSVHGKRLGLDSSGNLVDSDGYIKGPMPVAVATLATILALTSILHSGKPVVQSAAAPFAITLPVAIGSGHNFKVVIGVAATATASTIATATETDVMEGFVTALSTASANVIGYATSATSNTISLNGTTKGGVVGDWYEFQDIAAGLWLVSANSQPTGTTATPFSHV